MLFNITLFALTHYAALAGLALLSYAIGRKLTTWCDYHSVWERAAFCTSLGLGVMAYLIFALGLLHWLYPAVVVGVLVIMAIFCASVWKELGKELAGVFVRLRRRKLLLVAGIVSVVVLLPVFVLPLYPPTTFDATMYHLTSAKLYVEEHAVVFTPYIRFLPFPQLNEMLFTFMLLLYDDVAAQLVQFLMMVLVAVGLYAWGRRLFSSRAGLWATVLWLSNPLVLWLGACAYVENGLALFVSLGAYALFNWLEKREGSWLALSAIFCGFAAGSKYSALFLLCVFGLVVLYVGVRERRFTQLASFIVIVTLIAAPWYIRSFYFTGNPVHPYFASIFSYGHWSPEDLKGLLHAHMSRGTGKTVSSLLLLPWNLAFNQRSFHMDAPLSPIYFFALPILLLFGARNIYIRGLLILVLAYTLFWFYTAQVLRHLVLVIPLLSLGTAAVLERFLSWLPGLRKWASSLLIAALASALLISPGWLYAVHKVDQQGLPPTTEGQRESYLARHLRSYQAYQRSTN